MTSTAVPARSGISKELAAKGASVVVPRMLEAGAARCSIVDMASIHGTVSALGNGAYTAAKPGVVGITENAAAEYGPQGLRINLAGPATSGHRSSKAVSVLRSCRAWRANPPSTA